MAGYNKKGQDPMDEEEKANAAYEKILKEYGPITQEFHKEIVKENKQKGEEAKKEGQSNVQVADDLPTPIEV
jgi:hypothetical protein